MGTSFWVNRELGLPPDARGRRANRLVRQSRAVWRNRMPTTTGSRRGDKARRAIEKVTTKLERLTVTYVPVSMLQPNAYNPNRQSAHDFELLLRSMEDNGFTVPIVVRAESNVIVDGEHRWRAARQLGMHDVPVVYVTQSDQQAMLATLSHNRARGSEDVELTAALLRDLQQLGALDHAQDSLMLDDSEIRLLIDNVSAPDALAGDDFSAAWEPAPRSDGHLADGAHTSLTDAGADAVRSREAALAAAHTEQEREQARRDNRVYRVALVFSGDEADVVQRVLGERAAVTILALCRDRLAADAGNPG